jgi:hypothetical protein
MQPEPMLSFDSAMTMLGAGRRVSRRAWLDEAVVYMDGGRPWISSPSLLFPIWYHGIIEDRCSSDWYVVS